MNLLVCGGRDYGVIVERKEADTVRMYAILDDFALSAREAHDPINVVIHGAAEGADKLADGWAVMRGIQPVRCPAIWTPNGLYNPRAGLQRNVAMLWLKVDCVIAFPGGRGTAHMVSAARQKNVRVILIQIEGQGT